MRDLLFKNLTSGDKKRRVIATSETVDKEGVRSIIRRHFVCIVKEVKYDDAHRPLSHLYVIKEHNTREQKEKFFCRIKGSVYAISSGRLFLILFAHSLKIDLATITQDLEKYS